MSEKLNNPIHLRPRFTIDLKENHEIIIEKFRKTLKEEKSKYPCRISDGHIIIDVPKKEDHFWSPQLNIEVISIEEKTSLVKGLFGPKPQVWTFFMFIHFAIGIAFCIFSILLYVKWSLKEELIMPLMMTIFLPLIWVLLYFLGRIGKSTGHQQMDDLHELMISTLNS